MSYQATEDYYKKLQADNKRMKEALEQIVNCEEGAKDMWEIAKEALGV